MSQMRGELNQGRCAVVLTPPARHVHRAVLGAFTETGRAPLRAELERIARGQGSDPGAVLAELARRDVLAFDGSGEIRAAYPFSPSPTPIQVTWEGGPRVYAMCAIDALGISAMLDRPVTITAREPGSGRPSPSRSPGTRPGGARAAPSCSPAPPATRTAPAAPRRTGPAGTSTSSPAPGPRVSGPAATPRSPGRHWARPRRSDTASPGSEP